MEKEQDELDKLFKKGSQEPVNEPVFRETDWDAMEQLLDQQKKRGGIIYWLPRLGSVAAVLLLALLAWVLFRPQFSKPKNDNQVTIVQSKPDTGISGAASRRKMADSSKQKIITPANLAQNSAHPGTGKKTNRSYPYFPDERAAKPDKVPANTPKTNNIAAIVNEEGNDQNGKKGNNNANTLAAANNAKNNSQASIKSDSNNTNTIVANNVPAPDNRKDIGVADSKKDNGNSIAANTPMPKVKTTRVSNGANRPVFAIMAIASSDMNSASALNGRLGGNFGALFSVSSGKWMFSTGGMYSIKPYLENFADYHTPYTFQTNPSTVAANCRMIDIPLNVNYQVYKHGVNKFSVGTGLSSYIILREDYTFNYAGSNTYGSPYGNPNGNNPASFSVMNRNRNIMSILNLDITYEHQINSRFGLILQPYYKLPLTNVGYSQVKLQSTGIAVGLNMNLNTFKKPN